MKSAARIHHLALRVADPLVSATFYSELFGLPEIRRMDDHQGLRAVWLQAGMTVLMLERALRGHGAEAGSAHLLAFAAEDLPALEESLRRRGITISDRTGRTLYFNDPDGYRVGASTGTLVAPDA